VSVADSSTVASLGGRPHRMCPTVPFGCAIP